MSRKSPNFDDVIVNVNTNNNSNIYKPYGFGMLFNT